MRSKESQPKKRPDDQLSEADKRFIDFLVEQAVKSCS
jgi:hypothetical protein